MARTADPFLTLGFAGVDWIEHYLVHGPGDVQGKPIELDDEFAAFVVKAYQVDAKGNRKIRRAFLSRAKGRSKSGLAAMIASFEALGPCRFDHFAEAGEVSSWGYEYEPGEPVGRPLTYVEILNVATEEGQAGNTYDAIYYMLSPETCAPELLQDYGKIDVGITRTNLPGRRGFIEPVTSADSSKDGGKSTFIVADETHLWLLPRLKRLHGIMTRNLLKRKIASGWMLETSTMYAEGEDSVAEGTHSYAKATRKADRTLLFDHRQASDKWNLNVRSERLTALREAYGPAAEWMNLEAIADSWDDPQVSEGEFRRYWLNQPVPTEIVTTVIPLDTWGRLADLSDVPPRPVDKVAFSIDTTLARDRTSVSVAGVRIDDLPQVQVVDNRAGVTWVVGRMKSLTDDYPSLGVVVDMQSAAASLVGDLKDAGIDVIEMHTPDAKQAFGQFYDAAIDGRLRHLDQAELNAALKGATTRTVGDALLWNRKNVEADITPLVSATNALWGWTTRHGSGDILSVVW